ncbi:MAG: DNA-binding ferritin-like protein (Dps family) [Colwellia sp.]|jgi:DNA-binding ferritin-like protein (Dps family)|tara:strand:+ start:583 stop:870 length:288 start_codon:yes stop_codon:yes gene_type:complete
MKEFVVIHDYLVTQEIVGDWDGQEEDVAENMNEFYHTMYDLASEDIETEVLEQLLALIWDTWIGQEEIADIATDDIYDWCKHVLDNPEQHLQPEE